MGLPPFGSKGPVRGGSSLPLQPARQSEMRRWRSDDGAVAHAIRRQVASTRQELQRMRESYHFRFRSFWRRLRRLDRDRRLDAHVNMSLTPPRSRGHLYRVRDDGHGTTQT
jgi:hypothetical protein